MTIHDASPPPILKGFNKGFSWNKQEGKFTYSKDRELMDYKENLLDEVRASREVLLAMNSLVGDLTFTMEVMSDFTDNTIPTLDFTFWLEHTRGHPHLAYKFFSKPMSSRYVVLEQSAWAWSAKSASLAQEVQRRLQNTARDLPLQVDLDILNTFHKKLTRSGYHREQVRIIIESGITGFANKQRRGQTHRSPNEIQMDRELRKILEKSSWYLPKQRQEDTKPCGQTGMGFSRGQRTP